MPRSVGSNYRFVNFESTPQIYMGLKTYTFVLDLRAECYEIKMGLSDIVCSARTRDMLVLDPSPQISFGTSFETDLGSNLCYWQEECYVNSLQNLDSPLTKRRGDHEEMVSRVEEWSWEETGKGSKRASLIQGRCWHSNDSHPPSSTLAYFRISIKWRIFGTNDERWTGDSCSRLNSATLISCFTKTVVCSSYWSLSIH